MKNPIILLSIAFSLLSFSYFAEVPEKGKSHDSINGRQSPGTPGISSSAKGTYNFKSGWLNEKYFPQLQDSPCPFFIKPGC